MKKLLPLLPAVLALSACAPGETLARYPAPARRGVDIRPPVPPADPVLAAWEQAGRRALRSGLAIPPSFRELLRFPVGEPHAVAYRFTLLRGQSLHVRIAPIGVAAPLDAEMFEVITDDFFRPAPAPFVAGTTFAFTARVDGQYVLRLQPPPGTAGSYDVAVEGERILHFPVAHASLANVGSWFGDARDGGVRAHEGVDIFAPRGTPVLAAADGLVTAARPTPVGGNNVWVEDAAGGLSYYYAHLDEQRVFEGQRVVAGDTIGTVGNTGNARDVSPHLHFSIYLPGRVPVDPAPLLNGDVGFSEPPFEAAALGRWTRVNGSRVRLRASPSLAGAVLAELRPGAPLLVLGSISDWHRVVLSDGTSGFIAARFTEPPSSDGR